jgi:hypothetical protein
MNQTMPLSLFCLCLLCFVCAIGHAEIIFQQRVTFSDKTGATLAIEKGEDPVDALFHFCFKYGIDRVQRRSMQETICNKIVCTRSLAKVWSTPVFDGDKYLDHFILFEDVEPIDAIHQFVKDNDLGIGYRRAILAEACDIVDCEREKPCKLCINARMISACF